MFDKHIERHNKAKHSLLYLRESVPRVYRQPSSLRRLRGALLRMGAL